MTDNLPAKYEHQLETFQLPEELDNLDGLLQFENQIVIASRDLSEAMDRFGFHVHMILEYKLWRHRLDGKNRPLFNTQEDYLEYLEPRCRAGVSTMKSYHTGSRLAVWLGFDTIEKISRGGLTLFVEMAKMAKLDRETGKPIGPKSGSLPAGKDPITYYREVAEKMISDKESGLNDRSYNQRKKLGQLMEPSKPRVEFDIPDKRNPLYVIWVAEAYDGDGMLIPYPGNYGLIKADSPEFVLLEWYKHVGVTWKDEFR